eukprot:m.118692 g.118692  ORF g.118692 m.118692 type:complete len:118 (-) comp23137_c0_seq4:1084-1437(-)
MPQFFKKHGFYTAGGGKVYHPGHPANNDMPYSWNDYFFHNGDDSGCKDVHELYDCVCPDSKPIGDFYDNQLVNAAVDQMRQAKANGSQFFIAAGLRRPHIPWYVSCLSSRGNKLCLF